MRSDRNIENDQIKKPEGHTCKKMQKEDLLLYAVTDRHWLNGETVVAEARSKSTFLPAISGFRLSLKII